LIECIATRTLDCSKQGTNNAGHTQTEARRSAPITMRRTARSRCGDLSDHDARDTHLDVPTAVTTILGVLPEVKALRDRISKELPAFDLAAFDKLEDYALALSSAQTNFLTATQPPDDLQALSTEASTLHDRLLADAQALSRHNLVDGNQLAQLRGGNGYKNLAQDLQILSKVMQESWTQIQGKTPTVAEDLKTANQMSTRLMRIVGLREQSPALLASASEARMRAFTKFTQVYEDTRRAVGYLRAPQGDADSIAPTLYPGRPKRRGSAEPQPPTPQPPAVTPAPAPVSGTATTEVPAVSPAAASAAVAAQKGATTQASKGPFVS
jgi:hypothetical protein